MNITAESYGHAVILNLQGELTEDSLDALRKAVDHQLEADGVVDIVLNCEKVNFVDSTSLEYLLDLQDAQRERFGQVRLMKPDANVRKILEITRLDSSFDLCEDVREAVKAIEP